MSPSHRDAPGARDKRPAFQLRSPQLVIGGALLVGAALLAFWMVSDLTAGTLRAIGPAMLPRWLAVGLGVCGVAIIISGFRESSDEANTVPVRGPLIVLAAIFLFALTIRPIGLAFAGPMTLILGGYASAEARLRELIALAGLLTAFCIFLFGDMLNLPIPIIPIPLIELLPDGWSLKFAMRLCAGGLFIIGGIVLLFCFRRAAAPGEHDDLSKGA